MFKRNLLIRIMLLLGIIFSATFGLKFNLSQGFEFKGFWLSLPIQYFDFAGKSSNELSLTSHLIGYIFYLIFGILCIKRVNTPTITQWMVFVIFFGLIGIIFLSDFYSFYQDLNNQFTGRHLRYGFSVFLFGLVIYYKLFVKITKSELQK